MTPVFNEIGQQLGFPVPDWQNATFPPREVMQGRYGRLEPLETEAHARDLWEAFALEPHGEGWTYLPDGPFDDYASFESWVEGATKKQDMVFFAIVMPETGKAVGVACYLRIDVRVGSIEVGYLHFSPLLQRTPAATEAMYLMMKRAFELGYRRYEWKCHSFNEPSWRAALRLGFTFEGVFRQASIVKGHNRDTTWFSVIDSEWPILQSAFEKWLDPENFDTEGGQKLSLQNCRSV